MQALSIVLTAALVLLAFLTWRVYMRQAWFYGALESHSMLMLRLAALEKNIPVVWWDPDIAEIPPAVTRGHGEAAELQTIYLYLPQRERTSWKNASRVGRFRRWLTADI